MDVLDSSPLFSTLALVIAVAAGVGILWLWLSTAPRRVPPAPATSELRNETPALVDLLTGGFDVDDDAVPATAVDLASRGHYDLEQYGEDVVLRLRTRGAGDDLTAYESRVLRHIQNHATDGVAPAAVLTIGPDGVSERWFRGFVREVTKDGRQSGLCRRRFGFKHIGLAWLLVVIAFAPAYASFATADRTGDPTAWGSIGNLLLGLAFLCALGVAFLAAKVTTGDAQVDTPDGRLAAAHWLGVRDHYRAAGSFDEQPAAAVAIWERHLAYATAMGLAPIVQRQLPFETEHDRQAWSRATGSWRRVKVRYQAFRPGWGQHPGKVAITGLLQALVYGAIAYFALAAVRSESQLEGLDAGQRRWVSLGGTVIAIVAGLAAVYALVKLVVGVADLFTRRNLEGEVVRRRSFQTGHRLPKPVQWWLWRRNDEHGMNREHRRRTRHHIAIDDGTDDRVLAYEVSESVAREAPQGARVRVRVSRFLGYVSDVAMLTPPLRSAASEPGVAHPLIEEAVTNVASKAGRGLDDALARAAALTDDQGRPLLEQTDDDGVTLGQRIREGRDQIDRLRSDPDIASSPLAGLLDIFASRAPDTDRAAHADRHDNTDRDHDIDPDG